MHTDSPNYRQKKSFFDKMLTIYGRKPVLEALQDEKLDIYRLHMAETNKHGGIVEEIIQLAKSRQIEIAWHDRKSLSRISRNSKQDQGVAADITFDRHISVDEFLVQQQEPFRLIALDSISNPQNLGMIIRSACAGNIDGIILPKKGCSALSPLVIKASVGTLFKATIIHCDTLIEALRSIKLALPTAQLYTLSSHAEQSLFSNREEQSSCIYILGNETEGVSKDVQKFSDRQLSIPMNNGVESLNVAVTAALIAFNTTKPV